jgi:uncharacterized protein YqjF (DUF2071 family)
MVQGWYELASIHWRYDAADVARLLPAGLDVDTFDGSAWVGLIPFAMRGIGLPHGPAVPYLGSFTEVNVRTYVVKNGVPAVWFMSLDIDRLIPTLVARATYRLPYCWGSALHHRDGDRLSVEVRRRWPSRGPATHIEVDIGDTIAEPSTLDVFLSARWGLYSHGGRSGVRYAPVDHAPWPLRSATLRSLDDSLVTAAGLDAPASDPHVLFSEGVQVRIGMPRSA